MEKKGVLPEKLLFQFPMCSSPDRVDGLILFLTLMKGHLIHIYKKWVMSLNAMTRTRGALPAARWRKGLLDCDRGILIAHCVGGWSELTWKYPNVTGSEALSILGINCLRRGYIQKPKQVLVGFWHSCLGNRDDQTAFYLAVGRTLVLWGCWGLKNSSCQLLQWCTGDSITPTDILQFPFIS